MYQIYFLSIVINLIVGIVLARDILMKKFPSFGKLLDDVGEADLFRLAGGIAATAVGLLKLLAVSPEETPFIGDLFPALAGIAAGKTLLCEYFKKKQMIIPSWANRAAEFLVSTRQIWGLAAIAAAILHFFFNQVILL
ncbi:MAG: hypothetical protein FWG35_03130 [Spirochaetaceae bacterium]|nr:hypothetical protein [Spirochaetaceae bacterium]